MEENKKKYGKRGKPSMVFGWGQKKRFDLVQKRLALKDKKILDVGCGIGIYSNRFYQEGSSIFGVDIDKENIIKAKGLFPYISFQAITSANFPFEDNFFDIIFLHEVLEHVENDKKTIDESLRVLKPGGRIVIFAPNKWFAFETHGLYLGEKYIFGNIPFLSWMPDFVRKVFAPHVRIYTIKKLKALFKEKGVKIEIIDYVWPAFDKIQRKIPVLGRILKKIAGLAERSRFFKKFGVSIFAIIRKN